MNRKTLLSVLALLAVFVLLFAACTITTESDTSEPEQTQQEQQTQENDNSTQEEDTQMPLTENTMPIVEPGSVVLTFADQDQAAQYVSHKEAPVWELVQEITGITIDWQLSPDADSYETSMKTRLAAGSDLPDVLWVPGTVSDAVKYSQEGILIPLGDLIENYAPNIVNLYEEYPSIEASSKSPEGEIYFLINYLIGNENSNLAILRSDWLTKLNIDTPKTADDWYEVLKAVKTSDVNETGNDDIIAFGGNVNYFMSAFGMTSNSDYYWYDNADNVYFYAMQPRFEEYLTFLNKLYEEELLDPMYGSGESKIAALRVQNKVFSCAAWAAEADTRDAELAAAGYADADWQYILPPASDDGAMAFSTLNTARSTRRYAITKDCEETEAAIRLLDFIYASKEGTRITLCGIEGEDWIIGDDGVLQFTDVAINNPDYNLIGYLRTYRGAFVSPMDLQTEEFNNARISGKFAENLSKIKESGGNVQYPVIIPTAEEQEIEAALFTDIKSYIDEMTIKFVTGNEPLENYKDFVETLKSLNIEELTSIYQQQYDRYLGK